MSRLMAKLQRDELADEFARKVATALSESGRALPQKARSAAADPRRLRGIPVIARAVGGTMPGTQPEGAVLRRWHPRGFDGTLGPLRRP